MEFFVPILTAVLGAGIAAGANYFIVRRGAEAEERREALARAEQAEVVIRRYREPLVRGAFDLQSRVYNIVVLGFLQRHLGEGTPEEQEYAVESTLYLFGEYLGWVELLRGEVQFLDLGDVEASRRLADSVNDVTTVLLSDEYEVGFRLFRTEQRAIGEIMLTGGGDGQRQTLGYVAFGERRADPSFSKWFAKLEADIRAAAAEPGAGHDRLVALQHALIGVLDTLDPEHHRYATRHRLAIEGTN